jgi:hypothetical protein
MDRLPLLESLTEIIHEELDLNERLLALCERDSRLGFHSEAEGYKYFPEKIHWRMQQLQNVLAGDVPELEGLIRKGELLFPEYTGKRPTGAVAHSVACDDFPWSKPEFDSPAGLRWQTCGCGPDAPEVRWSAAHGAEALYVIVSGPAARNKTPDAPPVSSVLVKIEPRRLWPCKHFLFSPGTASRAELPDQVAPQSVEGQIFTEPDGWRTVLKIPLNRIGPNAEQLCPVRVDVRVGQKGYGTVAWRPANPITYRLRLGTDNPADLGWLIFSR